MLAQGGGVVKRVLGLFWVYFLLESQIDINTFVLISIAIAII
ncbi:hypothetical protein DGWBC_0836 [Dehalogenimonas sp. WBC-2]|nr:hypothetical protein DGWBC_0836 [Dehalogenimonas sp. WBC-2]